MFDDQVNMGMMILYENEKYVWNNPNGNIIVLESSLAFYGF